MNLNTQTLKRNSYLLLLTLITIDIGLAFIYLISRLTTGKSLAAFDFDRQWTVPIFFSAIQLFLIGISLVIVAMKRWSIFRRPSPWFLLAVGIGFLDLFIEKLFKFHDNQLIQFLHYFDWMPQFKSGGGSWIFVYIPLGLMIIIAGYRDLIAIFKAYPKGTLITVMGVMLSFLGGVIFEVIYYQFLTIKFGEMAHQHHSLVEILAAVKVTIEEFLEMLGESITLYGLSLFYIENQARIKKKG